MSCLPKRGKLDPVLASAVDFAVAQEGNLYIKGEDRELPRTMYDNSWDTLRLHVERACCRVCAFIAEPRRIVVLESGLDCRWFTRS